MARQVSAPVTAHIKALHQEMEYCGPTSSRGWTLNPEWEWYGKEKSFKFIIKGMEDSEYVEFPTMFMSVSGYTTFLEGAPITVNIGMQKIVMLSVTEA